MKFKDFIHTLEESTDQITETVDYEAFEKHSKLLRYPFIDHDYKKAYDESVKLHADKGITGHTVEGHQQIIKHALDLHAQKQQADWDATVKHRASQPPYKPADYGAHIQKTYYSGPSGSYTGD